MRTLSTILALVLFSAALWASPAIAWDAHLRVERHTPLAELSSQPVSPETDFDDSLPTQGASFDGVPAPAATPVAEKATVKKHAPQKNATMKKTAEKKEGEAKATEAK